MSCHNTTYLASPTGGGIERRSRHKLWRLHVLKSAAEASKQISSFEKKLILGRIIAALKWNGNVMVELEVGAKNEFFSPFPPLAGVKKKEFLRRL